MKKKVISLNFLTHEDAKIIEEAFPELALSCHDHNAPPSDEEVAEADILCGYMGPETILKAKKARWLFAYQAGIDRVVPTLRKLDRKIIFTNGTGLYGEQISEHLLALLLSLNRGIKPSVQHMDRRENRWDRESRPGRDVARTTVGVVGLGDIGDRFAKTVHAMGARVLGYKRRPSEKPAYVENLFYGDDLGNMLSRCDTAAICLPGTEKTAGLFNGELISRMKPGSILLNIGRGSIVDTPALIEALESGHLAGAGLDVTDPEPLDDASPLWSLDNVIITPHRAGTSVNMRHRVRETFMENYALIKKGKRPLHVIDLEEGY